MLFNSIAFAFYYLPVVLLVYYGLKFRISPSASQLFLILASFAFYATWEISGALVLILSIAVNFAFGRALLTKGRGERTRDALLYGVIAFNVLLLVYFKYTQFIFENLILFWDTDRTPPNIVLPLAISFFTFTQIAFQIDAHRGNVEKVTLLEYLMFVTFFPHLVAGPIYHHKEMMPQFEKMPSAPFEPLMFVTGCLMFAIGLFKKIVFADSLVAYADPVFSAAASGGTITFFDGWAALLAFCMQIYFDFAGYTDMAIGLALMLGVRMPVNFNSPLKATSIIDLWRRWHMSLTRFLNEYIFMPLALTLTRVALQRDWRKLGYFALAVAIPVNVTFLVSGIWHGAGWNFVLFGVVNGIGLTINYAWREWRLPSPPALVGWILTMLTFLLSLAFFRSQGFGPSIALIKGLVGLNGFVLPDTLAAPMGSAAALLKGLGVKFDPAIAGYLPMPGVFLWIVGAGLFVLLLPNSQQLLAPLRPTLADPEPDERAGMVHRAAMKFAHRAAILAESRYAGVAGISVALSVAILLIGQSWLRTQVAQFIYFQF